ncbi:uncharacterized protein LOC119798171 [Cyprinodon tularosa]|uniref:uncharacterized protein LOC119798171 n=1 Tax=Cyprinodon tularosa TaxID=77115 RepID=UPI0018E2095C|nr:uncharacterized protein LOC119798171 [Cyprinodon tularosa]
MSEDFSVEEEHEFFAEPFLYEPEYTDDELRYMDEAAAAQAEPQTPLCYRRRASETWWCKCGNCQAMPTEEESICCVDWDLLMPPLEDLNISTDETESTSQRLCVTQNTDYPPLLTRGVLEMFFHVPKINWKKRPRPAGPNNTLSADQYRLVAYRVVLEWILKGERLGKDSRRVLPACIVTSIRSSYPSPDGVYTGFKEAEAAFEQL